MRMDMIKVFGFILVFYFFSFIPTLTFSDMVYLKNEGSIEGIVEKEDETKITLNIGYGEIALDKKDIKYIYRYSPQEQDDLKKRWAYKYFTRPEFIPAYLQDIAIDFNNLENLRDTAVESKRGKDKIAKKIERLEDEFRKLNANLAGVSERLTRSGPKDNLEEYNSLVEEFNSLMAKIRLVEYNKDRLQKEMLSLEQRISGYIDALNLFRKKFKQLCDTLGEEAKEQNKYFFVGINKNLNEMESDFTRHTIDYTQYGSSIVVDTLLNDSIKANLIVDTGSSLVIISKEISNKLGLDMEQKPSILITLADGRKVKANSVMLESVKVKDIELKNVQAAVLENEEATEVDGLLGMSFLEKFLVSIDIRSNRLILEEFNP